MTKRIEMPAALTAAILAAAAAAYPRECCGLIEGVRDGNSFRILALHATANLAADADRFEIAPCDHIAAQKLARANSHAIIGCYHSHPGGAAQPSIRDRAGASQEDFLWLIASGTVLNAFVYVDDVYLDGEFMLATGADCVTSSL
jgi:proteasome lid subunit RPN8/RPN11